jgi:hypothetical protein
MEKKGDGGEGVVVGGKGHDDTTKGQPGARHRNIYTGKPKQASDEQAKGPEPRKEATSSR